ncbi:DUF397 domain-containing protein [Streptomyces angustmyceticus]|uniref:DUF397 domain-containing protein n=1 Tax=Streptomyces angustmyceticus TaxID=285578 RepID=UPI00344B073A
MSGYDLSTAQWRKSSYSSGQPDNCLEVSDGHPALVPVRDSKTPHGPVLTFPATDWASFLDAVKDGHLDAS